MQKGISGEFTDRQLGVVEDAAHVSGSFEELPHPRPDGAHRGKVTHAAPYRVIGGSPTEFAHIKAGGTEGGHSGVVVKSLRIGHPRVTPITTRHYPQYPLRALRLPSKELP
ncbi:hypothetical protein GCM10022402_48580 [Salinactinospora qingdaonensis]|uniref:Uncharacterized protein n=1 Tax=Salinactinospora qingdaonensis TaxID=702744 RepID=A0ABP7GIN3_9ACTN